MNLAAHRRMELNRVQSLSLPVEGEGGRRLPKPPWLRRDQVHGQGIYALKESLRKDRLHTVCEEARCPNLGECWKTGTATLMILGETCTRGCRFCNVKTGNPEGLVDADEPQKVARTVAGMGIRYVVLTMVDRDDLPDGGAAHVRATVAAVLTHAPGIRVEVLGGDFAGRQESLEQVFSSGLSVYAHNLETVERLTPRVRDARAGFRQSLGVLAAAKAHGGPRYTKSALMLGLGEEPEEVWAALVALREQGVDLLTIGQYLRPTRAHLSVKRYVHPEEFRFWNEEARTLGFLSVAAGPLVRSSYRASHLFPEEGS